MGCVCVDAVVLLPAVLDWATDEGASSGLLCVSRSTELIRAAAGVAYFNTLISWAGDLDEGAIARGAAQFDCDPQITRRAEDVRR